MPSRTFGWRRLLLITGACILSSGCTGPTPPAGVSESPPPEKASGTAALKEKEPTTTRVEEPPPPPEPPTEADAARPERAPVLPPPQPAEVGRAVERVFRGAVTVEAGRDPSFIVGDFNGDLSQDLAVVVRPAPEKLSEMNDELARWILVAPLASAPKVGPYADTHAASVERRRVIVGEGDVLLAVIHGFEAQGWRNPEATQTYVLKDAAGELMKTREKKSVVRPGKRERLPRLWGDVIAQEIGGEAGFLYYNGAKYAWFNPRRDKPAAPARVAHPGFSARAQE
jgi:hypothetical protein